MLELTTPRLRLIALDYDNLILCLDDYRQMEQNLGLTVTDTTLDTSSQLAIQAKLIKMTEDLVDYRWYTYWQIVLKAENRAIGLIGFKGRPNRRGEVELGYGMDAAYRNRGYMTEAVRALVHWALSQAEVSVVLAETVRNNRPSQAVLRKAGLRRFRETAHTLWWRIEADPNGRPG